MHFLEGVKESLRRLSNVIWMAEELHRVADFLLQSPPICFVVSISRRYSNSGSEKVSKVAHLSVGIVNLHIGKLLTHIDVIQSNSL